MGTLLERVTALSESLHIPEITTRLAETKALTSAPDLWDDQARAAKLTQQQARDEALLSRFNDIAELVKGGGDEDELLGLVSDDLVALEKQALLAGEHDDRDVIISIHAGAGGTDAQDWAEMLLRMYQRFIERGSQPNPEALIDRHGWKMEIIEQSRGEEAGLKSVTAEISGAFAYALLKAEAGVHRLVRQSPFNAAKLRQTSFAMVDIMPKADPHDAIEIDEKDLRIDTYRSSGKGGQGVNTTDSAVRITHIPTNFVVAIQNERSQQQNKAKALEILSAKLLLKKAQDDAAERAKLRGEVPSNEWGSQIRSYVLHPYKLVKDHRTDYERTDVENVLDGDVEDFMLKYIEWIASK